MSNKVVTPMVSKLLSKNGKKLKSRFTSTTHNNDITTKILQILPTDVSQNLPPYKTSRKASVLVPLIDNGMIENSEDNVFQSLSILFTKRSSHLNQHANEISFPGGHYEPTDNGCLMQTAMREAHEELIPRSNQDVWHNFNKNLIIFGQGETIPSAKIVPITPFFAYFRHQLCNKAIEQHFPGNKNEVSHVFTVTIKELLEVETTMPLKRLNMDGPVYPTQHGKIWGLTALILRPYLHHVLKPVFGE